MLIDKSANLFIIYGCRLPEWTLQILQPNGDLEMLARSFYQLFTPTAEMKKIISGYLLKEILDRCSQKMQSTLSPDRSLWLYFAHDVTMLNMLNSLNLYEVRIYFVRILYFSHSHKPFQSNDIDF